MKADGGSAVLAVEVVEGAAEVPAAWERPEDAMG